MPAALQLWPFWCEMMSPAHEPWLYPHVPAILEGLKGKGVQLAVRPGVKALGSGWGCGRARLLGLLPQLACAGTSNPCAAACAPPRAC